MSFFSPFTHGFLRVATATPRCHIADPVRNADETLALAHDADTGHVDLVVFPELGLTGYTNDDLFLQEAMHTAAEEALRQIVDASVDLHPVLVVGMPKVIQGQLFNLAIVVHRGRILGAVPKLFLPTYREFYEKRQFSGADSLTATETHLAGQTVPVGLDLLFEADDVAGFVLSLEICEDVWAPIPPSAVTALGGATVIANLSASNVVIGKSDYRHALCRVHSARTMAAYLYSAAGRGESSTDLSWDGHAMIYENGHLLAESERFSTDPQLAVADVDLDLLNLERARHNTFADNAARYSTEIAALRRIGFTLGRVAAPITPLRRPISRYPFIPDDQDKRDELCFEAYNIQVYGLRTRLEATGIKKIVIGVSGGLDSTQALIVAARAFDQLGLPRENILAYTLPAFATSDHTKSNAWALMRALKVSAGEIDMEPSAMQTLKDIGHPFADGKPHYDVTFENVQAGARTALLFRLANKEGGLVLGTGDLSELALGWSTYGVGDHMSHYNVNGSVAKTLIQHLIRWVVARNEFGDDASAVLQSIVDTEISPELVPGAESGGSGPAQRTEDFVGPYALQDFNLFYTTRYGLRPSKVAYLCHHAWGPESGEGAYSLAEIRRWAQVFLKRFFQTSQFKRSAVPNGPKVASGGSLSPRGDWRAPSDSRADMWLAELDGNVPET
ncbi:MAG: NAD(+) synthase [Pseudomonadota bacterium]